MTTHDLGRLAALAAVLLAAPGAGRAATAQTAPTATPPAPTTPSTPSTPSTGPPRASAAAFPPESLGALTRVNEADYVIDVLRDFMLLSARRPGPELSHGEPKEVALVVDRKWEVTSQLDVAWSVGDQGVSVTLSYDYLGSGLIRTKQRDSSCDLETNECRESTRYTTYKLSSKGTFEQVTIDGRYCDRRSGEEVEMLSDPDKPLEPLVTYRSKGKPGGLRLRVVEANPQVTRLTVQFPEGAAVYTLVLADDYTRLTSAGSDGSAAQTFARAACAK